MGDVPHDADPSSAPAAAYAASGVVPRPAVSQPQPKTLASRIGWATLFLVPVAVYVVAAFVSPNPHGEGTATELGLPPCGFYVVTGLPCPGCGLTTSFAYMIRGNVVEAVTANPFGVMLFLVTGATALVAAVGFVKAWPVIRTLDRLHADKWAILLSACSLTVWVVKVVTILGDL